MNYSETMTFVQLMIDGLKKDGDQLPAGITKEFITALESKKATVQKLNSEQEQLKAEMKKKTEIFNQEYQSITQELSKAKRRIKADIEQSLWKYYGITDKR